MKFSRLKLRVCGFLFLCTFQYVGSTLILTSMLLAAKTGMLLGKMGVGGMMMMLLAANQYNHDHHQAVSYRKARSIRSIENDLHALHLIKPTNSTNDTLLSMDEETTNRMVRQIDAALDSFTCIPKFVCGINSETPSKKTSLLNDYGHLLKLVFADDDEDDEGGVVPLAREDEELGLALEEDEGFQDELNDKLIDEDPSLLPYVLKDLVKKKPKTKKNKNNKNLNRHGLGSLEGIQMGPERYPHHRPGPQPYPYRPRPPPPPRKPQSFSPLSALTAFLPKLETSLGSKPDDSDFDRDPFFAGFRSMKAIEDFVENNTSEEFKAFSLVDTEEDGENKPLTGQSRLLFLERKAKELEESEDALDKYRIAEEVGKKTKSKKDCATMYKKCPYSWNEITKMVDNMRGVVKSNPTYSRIMNGVGNAGKSDSISLVGKNSDGTLITTGMNTGLTTVMHDLGNGNMVEISMKLLPKHQTTGPISTIDLPSFGSQYGDVQEGIKSSSKTSPAIEKIIPEVSSASEEELNAAALAFQNKNSNNKRKNKRKPKPKPIEDFPVINKEIYAESVVDDDDEAADQFPVLIDNKDSTKGKRKRKNKKSKKKKTNEEDLHEDGEDRAKSDKKNEESTSPNGNNKSRRQGQPAKTMIQSSSYNYNSEYIPPPRRPSPIIPVNPVRLPTRRKRPVLIPLVSRRGSLFSRRPKSDYESAFEEN